LFPWDFVIQHKNALMKFETARIYDIPANAKITGFNEVPTKEAMFHFFDDMHPIDASCNLIGCAYVLTLN
jgi:hypothetical protein